MKNSMKSGFLFLIIIVALVTTLLVSGKLTGNSIQATQESITLSGEGGERTIFYSEIRGLSYEADFDEGEPVDGGTKLRSRYGLWENGELGTYESFTGTKIPDVIICRLDGKIVVFNYENAATTKAVYEEMRKYVSVE